MRGVNIVLETVPIRACPLFDTSGNGKVEIAEIIAGVDAVPRGSQ